MDWHARVDKKLDSIDEKLDTLVKEHQGVFKDVEWLKGSLKVTVTILLPAILGLIGFLAKKHLLP